MKIWTNTAPMKVTVLKMMNNPSGPIELFTIMSIVALIYSYPTNEAIIQTPIAESTATSAAYKVTIGPCEN